MHLRETFLAEELVQYLLLNEVERNIVIMSSGYCSSNSITKINQYYLNMLKGNDNI